MWTVDTNPRVRLAARGDRDRLLIVRLYKKSGRYVHARTVVLTRLDANETGVRTSGNRTGNQVLDAGFHPLVATFRIV